MGGLCWLLLNARARARVSRTIGKVLPTNQSPPNARNLKHLRRPQVLPRMGGWEALFENLVVLGLSRRQQRFVFVVDRRRGRARLAAQIFEVGNRFDEPDADEKHAVR